MPHVSRDLRAASDALQRDLEALGTLEEEKRGLPLDDPRLTELATQITEIAGRVLAGSSTQKDLTEAAVAAGTSGTIETTRRPAGDILAEWRGLERGAGTGEPRLGRGSPGAVPLAPAPHAKPAARWGPRGGAP